MRRTTISSLGLIAILAAACTSAGVERRPVCRVAVGRSPSSRARRPSRRRRRPTRAPGQPHARRPPASSRSAPTTRPIRRTSRENADGNKTAPWELGDPTNGQGFESAVALRDRRPARLRQGRRSPGSSSRSTTRIAPGPKTFDIDLNQVNYNDRARRRPPTCRRATTSATRRVVVLEDSPLAKATTSPTLKDGVFGAQVGTTSYDADHRRHRADQGGAVYDTNDPAIKALKNKTRSTASSSTCRPPTTSPTSSSTAATIVGQFQGRRRRSTSAPCCQGQPADRLRQRGDRGADARTARSRMASSGCRSRTRPGLQP